MQTIAIEKFPLKWRWTDENYCLLPDDELAKIRPLSTSAAAVVWQVSRRLVISQDDCSPSSELFAATEFIPANDSNSVNAWLRSKIPDGEIIVSWLPDLAVLTETDVFIKYWEEFCYPSSDDVTIWSKSEEWVVQYHHYQKFSYGNLRSLVVDSRISLVDGNK